MMRAARREPLFHPNDGLRLGTFKPDPPPPAARTTSAPLLKETITEEPIPFMNDETIKAI